VLALDQRNQLFGRSNRLEIEAGLLGGKSRG
jgi:hypothetical protein